MMKRFIISVCVVLLALACGPLPQEQEATSAVGITAPDGYSVTCATNYTRKQPHFCARTNAYSTSGLFPFDSTCRAQSFSPAPPSNANLALVSIDVSLVSQNAVDRPGLTIGFYYDSDCTQPAYYHSYYLAEQVATVAGTGLGSAQHMWIIPLISSNFYYKNILMVGTGHSFAIGILGYYD